MTTKAAILKQELLALKRASKDSKLHAAKVISWAKSHPNSALHSQFDWDDETAAQEYRLIQARTLIKLVIVSDVGEPEMVSLTIDRSTGGGYREIGDVIKNKELSRVMLADALAYLEAAQERFNHIQELTSVWEAVARVRQNAKRRASRNGSKSLSEARA